MSYKILAKACMSKALVLQDFCRSLKELNYLRAQTIYAACTDISPEEFERIWNAEVREVAWVWNKIIKRGL